LLNHPPIRFWEWRFGFRYFGHITEEVESW
jgi:hypothetical protein